jgi:hypothetical protein
VATENRRPFARGEPKLASACGLAHELDVATKPESKRQDSSTTVLDTDQEDDRRTRSGPCVVSRRKYRRGTTVNTLYMDGFKAPDMHSSLFQWQQNPSHPTLDCFTIRRTGDTPTKVRVILQLQQSPEQFRVLPELGEISTNVYWSSF